MIEYAVAVGSDRLAGRLFGPSFEALADVPANRVGDVLTELESDGARRTLARAEVLLTGWETPQLTAKVLRHAPRLRRVIHAGGAADGLFPDGAPGITASDVGVANALPVAEYSLAMILLANKDTFRAQQLYRERRAFIDREAEFEASGNYLRTVGVVERVPDGTRPGGAAAAVPDAPGAPVRPVPHGSRGRGARRRAGDPARADEPQLRRHAARPRAARDGGADRRRPARPHARRRTLINTARGVIVDAEALERELVTGRINAVLDVTDPEPLPASSPLYDLPNVVLTPHIAGSMGTELRRMGDTAAADLARYARSEP